MKIEFEINEDEFEYIWENNASITITQPSNKLLEIEANKEGLISLAKILFGLAYTKELPPEIHLWGETGKGESYCYGDLDEGSLDLSIVRIKKEGRKNKISSF